MDLWMLKDFYMSDAEKPHFIKSGIGYLPRTGFAWLLVFGVATLAILLSNLIDVLGSSLNGEVVRIIQFIVLALAAITIWFYARSHSD